MGEWIDAYRAFAQYAAIYALLLIALRWGDGPERASAIVFALMPFGELAYHGIFGPEVVMARVDVGHFILSVAAALAFLWIGLRANRVYPLWLTAFQSTAVLGHLVRDFLPKVEGLAYQILVIAPSYAMLIVLAVGIILHHRRRSRYGPYRPWRK